LCDPHIGVQSRPSNRQAPVRDVENSLTLGVPLQRLGTARDSSAR
jgi:hypothetical protein